MEVLIQHENVFRLERDEFGTVLYARFLGLTPRGKNHFRRGIACDHLHPALSEVNCVGPRPAIDIQNALAHAETLVQLPPDGFPLCAAYNRLSKYLVVGPRKLVKSGNIKLGQCR
ncbi:MAG TPA: hypothetical protein VKV95_00145 [Terriglobia bacterium]|nr:hypothetical protein [Terriglobia bacterium]